MMIYRAILIVATLGSMSLYSCAQRSAGQEGVQKRVRDETSATELLKKAQKELERNPHTAFWRSQAALAYLELDDIANAQSEIDKAIQADPNNAIYYYLAERIAESRGDERAQAELVRKALSLDPKNPLGHYRLGLILEKQAEVLEAEAQYKTSLRLLEGLKAQEFYSDPWGNKHQIATLQKDVRKQLEGLKNRNVPTE